MKRKTSYFFFSAYLKVMIKQLNSTVETVIFKVTRNDTTHGEWMRHMTTIPAQPSKYKVSEFVQLSIYAIFQLGVDH